MSIQTARTAVISTLAALGLAAGVATLAAPAAQAATCPSVDPTTGAVSPAPSAGVDWSACNLANAALSSADLSGANLSGANLAGADVFDANFTGASLSGADLTSATMDGGTNFSGADLMNANFASATVDGTFTGATVTGSNFTGSDFISAVSGSMVGSPSALPSNWMVAKGYFVGPTASLVDADLSGANLTNADLRNAGLTDGNLTGANLTNADMQFTELTGVRSGSIVGAPWILPTFFGETGGFLIGPAVNLAGDNLSGLTMETFNLEGANLQGANLTAADLSRAFLDSANLSFADFTGANLSSAVLSPGTNLNDATLTGANMSHANLTGAQMLFVNLTNADLASANLTNANMFGDTFSNTLCPNGSNSDAHVPDGCATPLDVTPPAAAPAVIDGVPGAAGWYTTPVTVAWNWTDDGALDTAACTQSSTTTHEAGQTLAASCADMAGNIGQDGYTVKVDTTRPAVTVTGVRAGARYRLGAVPAPGCQTVDSVSGVQVSATLTVTHNGPVGTFTATCAGAVSVAGSTQLKPVSVSYSVLYGFGGFIAPRPGTTISKSARTFNVQFRLTTAAGKPLTSRVAAALAVRHVVRVQLAGPRIRTVTVNCRWVASRGYFECSVAIPAGVRTGRHRYTLSAMERFGQVSSLAPAVGKAANPETLRFR